MRVAVIVLADVGSQELVDQNLPFWCEMSEPIFVFTHPSSVNISDTSIVKRVGKQPLTVIEYEGGYDEVMGALAWDDQLKEFDFYLILTPDTLVLEPLTWIKKTILTTHELLTSPWISGLPAQPLLWNRAAIVAVSIANSTPKPPTTAVTVTSWKVHALEMTITAKLPIDIMQSAVNCCTGIVSAGKAIEGGATILTGVNGGATLAFVTACHQHATTSAKEVVPRILRGSANTNNIVGLERVMTSGKVEDMTFVTALFDIRSREESTPEKKVCKTAADYLRLGAKLLEWDVNLFLMVEPNMVADIYKKRDKLGLRNKTFIYPLTIEQSRYFSIIKKLQDLYAAGKIPTKYWPPKDTPLYVWCMMQKADALRRALDMNLFQSTRFFWIDYGIFHIAESPKPSIDHLLNQLANSDHSRLRCNMLRSISPTETDNAKAFYGQLQQCFAGGFFGGKIETMKWFVDEWEKEIYESTDHFPTLDQAMFGRIYNRNRAKFLPINGFTDGHRRLLQPLTNAELLKLVQVSVAQKQWDEANCLLTEFVPRPWQTEPLWADRILQRQVIELVAEIDKALTGTVHPHTHVALVTILSHSSQTDVKIPAADNVFIDVKNVITKLNGWKVFSTSEVSKIHAYISDYASRRSVTESLPCLNAMLQLLNNCRISAPPLRRIPVWVVNLDSRPDRWHCMQETFALLSEDRHRIFSEFRRFPAIDGSKERDLLTALPFWNKVRKLPYIRAVACTATHMKMWQEWANTPAIDGQQWLQILEDDATLSPSFMRDMTGLQHLLDAGKGLAMANTHHFIWNGFHMQLQPRWDAVATAHEPIKLIPLKDNWHAQGIGGTFGYAVSKDGARLALKLLNEGYLLEQEPIDVWLMRRLHHKIKHISTSRPIILSNYYIPGQPYDGDIVELSNNKK